MTTKNQHLDRLEKMRQARDVQTPRALASPSTMVEFLDTPVDQAFIEGTDSAKAFSNQLEDTDAIATQREAQALLDSLNTGSAIEKILEPVFLSLFDGVMRAFKMGTKQGLTASRLYQECRVFTYANAANSSPMVDSYTENLNERDNIAEFGSHSSFNGGSMTRKDEELLMRDGKKMKAKKEAHFNGDYRAKDEYDGKDIFLTKAQANSEGRSDRYAETDHIVSCAEICNSLKSNKALHLDDIKTIINIDENYAVTSKQNNAGSNIGKFDKTRDELQAELDQGYVQFKNKKHKLSDEERKTRQNQIEAMDKAQQAIDTKTNVTVAKNVLFDNEVQITLGKDAANASSHYALGNVIIFAIKPIYYELSDCIKNGIEEGVGADSFSEALKIRLGRMKDHLWSHALPLLKDAALGFFKNFLSMLMEGILNCFVGVFKQVMRLVKEGFKILMSAIPILRDEKTTSTQKGDALLKLFAGSLSIFASLAIESWLSSSGMPEWLAIIASSMLTAVVTSLVMHLLDKMDLFGVNREIQSRRIDELLQSEIDSTTEGIFSTMAKLA
ncbi:hypothetical protein [Aeromonas caviae]|uniref:hypothetical protein n=1 Tax=Aeromonas TaxID=642 RepID=UPI000B2D7088|nr:hypothetical protein [Aeromonas caviae]